jgi:predicted amidohydrolase YtcJ
MSADLAIVQAKIVAMTSDSHRVPAEALAVSAGRILDIGSETEIRGLIDSRTQVLNLGGKTVLPGFFDTHVHFVQTGLSLRGPDLAGCATVDEVLEVVRHEVKDRDAGTVVFFHRCKLAGLDRPLTRRDLDRVSPDNPVAVGDFELHSCVINSRALEGVSLDPISDGVELVDGSNNQPTGLMTGLAHIAVRSYFYDTLDEAVYRDALELASNVALKAGVTTVHAIEGRDAFGTRHMQLIGDRRESLPIRFVLYYQGLNLPKAVKAGAKGIADIWVDGSYMDHTAALLEPYADDPTTRGSLFFDQRELDELVFHAHSLGLQVSLHAIGDAAIEQVLNAYACAYDRDPSFALQRPRIEHFSLPIDAQIEKAKRLGVAVAMQPVMSTGPQKTVVRRLGSERAARRHPYRKILSAGILVAGGSDSDVTPIAPLAGIHALVNQSVDSRRLSVMEALSLFTVNGAQIAHEGDQKGTIEPGKLADLVVLSGDPLTIHRTGLKDMPVYMTIVGGKILWSRTDSMLESA